MKPGDVDLISWRQLAVLCLDYKYCPICMTINISLCVGKVGWKDAK